MDPFREADLDQLQRILRIMDHANSDLYLNFLEQWIAGENPDTTQKRTTQEFIEFWEIRLNIR